MVFQKLGKITEKDEKCVVPNLSFCVTAFENSMHKFTKSINSVFVSIVFRKLIFQHFFRDFFEHHPISSECKVMIENSPKFPNSNITSHNKFLPSPFASSKALQQIKFFLVSYHHQKETRLRYFPHLH